MKKKQILSIPLSCILLYCLIILNSCQKDLYREKPITNEIIEKISNEKELKILSMLTDVSFEESLLAKKNNKGFLDIEVWERKRKLTNDYRTKIQTKYNLSPDESYNLINESIQRYRKELIRNNELDEWRRLIVENSLFSDLVANSINKDHLENILKASRENQKRANNNIDTVDIERFTIDFVPVYTDLYGFQNLLEKDGCATIAANYALSNKARLDHWGPGIREIRTFTEREAANEAISLVYSSYITAKKACSDSKNTVPDPIGGGSTGGGNNGTQTPIGDKEPASYPWRTKLKTLDDYLAHLPRTEGMFKANEDGELIYDENGDRIPVLDAFNCHYHAFGPNNDPYSYENPFKRILEYPDLSNFNKLAPTDKIRIGDRVTYYIWENPSQHALSAIKHSAIVVEVDVNGFATMVSSKMGESFGIIYHHPRDIPEAYGPTNPITVFSNGDYRYNRIYYRPK